MFSVGIKRSQNDIQKYFIVCINYNIINKCWCNRKKIQFVCLTPDKQILVKIANTVFLKLFNLQKLFLFNTPDSKR
ncbi:MAG: hypothetical protein ACI8P3_002808 [Saprospiraceae bacterium]|jgi:hypothetical protein